MPKASLPADERAARPLWFNASFLLMWSSVAASGFGDRVIMLSALTLLGGTGENIESTSINAGLSFFFFLPYILLGSPAGWLADRLPRKWIMLTCDELRGIVLVCSILLIPASGSMIVPEDQHYKIYTVMLIVGCLAATFNPSRNATIPQIVPMKQLQAANALVIGIATIASLLGLLIGGRVIEEDNIGSVRGALMIGAGFYAVSGTFFAFMRVRDSHRPDTARPRQKKGVFKYIRTHRGIWQAVAMNTIVWSCAMVVYASVIGLCKTKYDIPEDQIFKRYTEMTATLGAGMLFGAVWMAWINTRRESTAMGLFCLFMAGVCMALVAVVPSAAFGFVLLFGTGFFGNGVIICFTTLLQSITPNHIRGRVMGFNTFASTTGTVVVNFLIWRMPNADTQIIPALAVLATAMMLFGGWALWHNLTRGPQQDWLLNLLWRVARAYALVWHRVKWINKHNVPSRGAAILACNHTTAVDPFVIQTCLLRHIRWLMLTSYRFKWLEPMFKRIKPIFLDREPRDTRKIREIIGVLKNEDDLVAIFPEGGLQRDNRELKPFQPGLGMIAKRAGVPIVPAWIDGTPVKRSILAHLLTPSRSSIIFGEPYLPDKTMTNEQVVEDLRRRMVELARMIRQEPSSHQAIEPSRG